MQFLENCQMQISTAKLNALIFNQKNKTKCDLLRNILKAKKHSVIMLTDSCHSNSDVSRWPPITV